MGDFGIKSREELGGHLRTVASVVAEYRGAMAAEDRKAALCHNPRQITIGQIMMLVALWALGLAVWRLNR